MTSTERVDCFETARAVIAAAESLRSIKYASTADQIVVLKRPNIEELEMFRTLLESTGWYYVETETPTGNNRFQFSRNEDVEHFDPRNITGANK